MKILYAAATLGASFLLASSASASVYSDDLGKCLVAKTSDQDKAGLIQWIFAALSASPAIQDMAKVTTAQHDAHDRAMAAVFDRLILVDCRQQSADALKYDGINAVQEGFKLLGQVAMQSLVSDATVSDSMGRFTQYIDKEKLADLMQSSGIKVTDQPSKTGK
ncbi:hypothetical protein PX554_02960 [Sphingomonas sp. H39-1-10]|uniref:hypothetical protein n=1 Tax=Sphingomonas TaxID=13687 RepID=UPI00088C36EF|nr:MULTISPECIES: hypothetical protein [Sphingomonas]MDF0487079.1 hypothetical protein [Sphingomonas pollutisoli]SDA26498.1 hypothetical protein SAMN03159340_02022 [Sphingomonas sp. NFR15]